MHIFHPKELIQVYYMHFQMFILKKMLSTHGQSRVGDMGSGQPPPPPGKLQVDFCLLINTDTDLIKKPLDPRGPMATRGRFERPS